MFEFDEVLSEFRDFQKMERWSCAEMFATCIHILHVLRVNKPLLHVNTRKKS